MNCSELAEPQNWVAHGGCWTFTDSGIYAQAGIMGLQLIYYRKDKYANFELIAQVNKLTEGGALGVVFRFDEIKNQGYCYLLYPHGQYGIMLVNKEQDDMLFHEPAAVLNQGTNIWNTIKIVCVNNTFALYVNNQLLTTIIDKSLSKGRIGFFLGGDPRQKAIFRIISIKEL